jgi:hypothetical protein
MVVARLNTMQWVVGEMLWSTLVFRLWNVSWVIFFQTPMLSTDPVLSPWERWNQLLMHYFKVLLKLGTTGVFWDCPTHKLSVIGCGAVVAPRHKTSANFGTMYLTTRTHQFVSNFLIS